MSKTIRDPVHNIIEVSTDAVALMDTWAFQRLRRIRQLGVAWLVYPAAEHSRFTHSVGVYHMSKRIMDSLVNNSREFNLDATEKRLVAFAALLHDIGHAPFSHVLEKVMKNIGEGFKHEEMTVKIIKECDEISSLLNKHDKGFADKVCQVIDKDYPNSCIASIVSSQLDADRIDYLLRDSYMTGADYGAFDVDWLLKNMKVEKSTFPSSKGQPVVSVDCKKGLHVLEQYLIGRYSMHTHVYFHKVVKGFEVTIMNIIRRVLEQEYNDLVGFKYFSDLSRGTITVDDYLKVDDFSVWTWFKQWREETEDAVLKELLDHLFSRTPYYKAIEPSRDTVDYSKAKTRILDTFQDDNQKYFFWEDDSPNIAYKDLYIADVLEEIHVTLDGETIPLSAVKDSIVTSARGVLSKKNVMWYVKREGTCID